mmetsp:Transcript_40402/g.61639  ORF Transcript_40402/g.61639 Transcript_40402/m.61639 type:complete len:81 (-) Transcript_40402:925-1167(-)
MAPKQESFWAGSSGRRESSKPKTLSSKPPLFNNRQLQKKFSTQNLVDVASQKPPSLFVQQIKAAQKIESNISKGKQVSTT